MAAGPVGALLRLCNDDEGGSLHRHLTCNQDNCIHADCAPKPKAGLLQQKVPPSP